MVFSFSKCTLIVTQTICVHVWTLNHVICHNGSINPIGYPLPRFDQNVKELEEDD